MEDNIPKTPENEAETPPNRSWRFLVVFDIFVIVAAIALLMVLW